VIESPSKESLKEARKFQNLRADPLKCIRFIQSKGLWVTAGFIVGFDSDTEDIFELQRDFIERAAIPWAMVGLLQAPPTTPLYDRMLKQDRLLTEGVTSNFNTPNFKTILPLPVLLKGFRVTLDSLYSPSAFYDRAYRSLVHWKVASQQKASFPYNERLGRLRILGTMIRSIFHQGIRSSYRKAYWTFFIRLLGRWSFDPLKLSMGFLILISGHHFIRYARTVVAQLESELSKLQVDKPATDVRPLVKTFEMR
jgi:radical SAM superfamily enzyme YgiQ (UPF0313 family)